MSTTELELCEYLPWDSTFFGKRIGRIVPTIVTDDILQDAIRGANAKNIECIYLLCETTDDASVQSAEKNGFHLVDIRVTKGRSLTGVAEDWDESRIRPPRRSDIPVLKALAGKSHTNTRFYIDTHFDRARCSRLYEEWIEKSCNGWAQAVFVASPAAKPAGYITCHLDTPAAGRVGLIAVAPDSQGQGLGVALFTAALAWLKRRGVNQVSVATQGRNIVAQRLYERCGFATQSVQLWYHRWSTL